jgi:hypothetical protein
MARQVRCGPAEARARRAVARRYLDVADLAAGEDDASAWHNVAAGNAAAAANPHPGADIHDDRWGQST